MPKPKKHIWTKVKGVPGTFKCQRCQMFKYKQPSGKVILVRDGGIDNSRTKNNCFILSKD